MHELHIRALAIACVLLLITACYQGESEVRSLQRGIHGVPESLDPHKFTSTQVGDILRDMGEGLVAYTADGKIEGGVAESWELASDGLQYVFHIRDDAKWSNGDDLIADHFVDAFRRLVSPEIASPSAAYVTFLKNASAAIAGETDPENIGVKAPDDSTLVFELDTATPYFLQLLTHPSTFPIHKSSMDSNGRKYTRPGNYITNGAYVLVDEVVGSQLELERNENYWNDKETFFDKIRYHIVDSRVEIGRYRAGELDITENVDASQFGTISREYEDHLRIAPYLGVYYYGFNLTKEPFKSNRKLREALSMAIDRESLAFDVIGRGEQPAFSWVPPGIEGYTPQDMSFAHLDDETRIAQSRRLFTEAGYDVSDPLKFELRYNTLGGHGIVALAVQAMWRDVLGIEVSLVNEEFGVLYANIQAMEVTDVFRLSWTGDYNDPHTFLQLFESENSSNVTAFSNSRYDALLAEAALEVDSRKRMQILQEAEKLVMSEFAVVPLYFYVSKHLVRPDVTGWQSNPLDYHYSKHLAR